jgi:riboflavin synthase
MFTGLIEQVGRVERVAAVRGNRLLTIEAGFAGELAVGDSVAVNGACLTVTAREARAFTVEAVASTLAATTLGELRAGSPVNLERALALGDRLGGHMVLGHVDEVGKVRRIERHSGHWTIAVTIGRGYGRLLVEKGSVCLDGISLTVAERRPSEFSVNVIPHTWENTNLRFRRAGERVNVEYDMLVKAAQQADSG